MIEAVARRHCTVDGCDGFDDKCGHCWAHWKQRTLFGRVRVMRVRRKLSREARLWEAFYASLEVDELDAEAFERVRARVRMAALRFAMSLGEYNEKPDA